MGSSKSKIAKSHQISSNNFTHSINPSYPIHPNPTQSTRSANEISPVHSNHLTNLTNHLQSEDVVLHKPANIHDFSLDNLSDGSNGNSSEDIHQKYRDLLTEFLTRNHNEIYSNEHNQSYDNKDNESQSGKHSEIYSPKYSESQTDKQNESYSENSSESSNNNSLNDKPNNNNCSNKDPIPCQNNANPNSDSSKKRTMRSCLGCGKEEASTDLGISCGQGHYLHGEECLHNYFRHCLSEENWEKLVPIKCPMPNCHEKLLVDKVIALMTTEEYDRYIEAFIYTNKITNENEEFL